MAARSLAPLAGASLLAFALPASAQDHSHHPVPPEPVPTPAAPATAPRAGHDMPTLTVQAPANTHQGHDMPATTGGEGHAMISPLGHWPMSRDASGTSWQPDLSEHGGVHAARGDWSFMGHATLTLTHDRQKGPRGDRKAFVGGMIMGSARRDLADDTHALAVLLQAEAAVRVQQRLERVARIRIAQGER